MNNKTKKEVRKQFREKFGHSNLSIIKAELKKIATNPYGAFTSEIQFKGFSISYTANSNCFATFLIKIQLVGMVNSLALDKKSFTKAGKQRGCGSYYFF